mmetsp:Transcript_7102/g.15306  ORF Transcript_7102/g.15306 Transcript_7102/m.15306 type:complete len:339 (+) Transcript_7102:50-1066(+)
MQGARTVGRIALAVLVALGIRLASKKYAGHKASHAGRVPRVIFSDIDGTLAHYPYQLDGIAEVVPHEKNKTATLRYITHGDIEMEVLALPSSKHGPAYISKRTIELVKELRSKGVLFVLMTAARASTYIERRKILPAADWEVFENGGRIWKDGAVDPDWASKMKEVTGFDGKSPKEEKLENRPEQLWEFCRELQEQGWKIDTAGYETEFRVEVSIDWQASNSVDRWEREVVPLLSEIKLGHSLNLGMVDVFPRMSGKANAARYILDKIGVDPRDAVAMFDDENDLELGDVCGRCLLPGVSHESVWEHLNDRPNWKVMTKHGPLATEEALEEVLKMLPA